MKRAQKNANRKLLGLGIGVLLALVAFHLTDPAPMKLSAKSVFPHPHTQTLHEIYSQKNALQPAAWYLSK